MVLRNNKGGPFSPGSSGGMVELRDATQADAHAIANVLVQSWRAAYRGLLPSDVLAGLSVPDAWIIAAPISLDPAGRRAFLAGPLIEWWQVPRVPLRRAETPVLPTAPAGFQVPPAHAAPPHS